MSAFPSRVDAKITHLASAENEASKSSPGLDRNGVAFVPSLSATNNAMSNGAKLVNAILYYGGAARFAGMLVARTAMAASCDGGG